MTAVPPFTQSEVEVETSIIKSLGGEAMMILSTNKRHPLASITSTL